MSKPQGPQKPAYLHTLVQGQGKTPVKILFAALIVFACLLGIYLFPPQSSENGTMQIKLAQNGEVVSASANLSGYARASGPKDLRFPADLGPHPDFQTEWWYYTGNLDDVQGNHYGYQLTFFRRRLLPPGERSPRSSQWAADQVYMAHLALTDVSRGRHDDFERLSRGALGLAGAQAEPYHVWLEDWSVEQIGSNEVHLTARQGEIMLDLYLTDVKGPTLHGDGGYSQKGPDAGNASYYYSQTRLETRGTIATGKDVVQVIGLSWKDHEYSTSALSPGQVGWDWFSIQLDNEIELMFFQMRREDGSIDPFSSGTVIKEDGGIRHLSKDDFRIDVLGMWTSPASGAIYPAHWTVEIPVEGIQIEIEPYLADQEMNVSYSYWEGAVLIRGTQHGIPVEGDGYIELTGYSGSMSGEF